jgi:hypothetical protein
MPSVSFNSLWQANHSGPSHHSVAQAAFNRSSNPTSCNPHHHDPSAPTKENR